MPKKKYQYSRVVRIWLMTGLILLIGQVILGGITRLTGSGLSITKWEVITGVIPPLNEADWQKEFELYQATPQFHKLNSDFTLKDFKFIYFWEFFHRFWVRALGIIFAIPFVFFLIRKQIDTALVKKLLIVVFFAGLTASAGWIMVMSGLVDRPWVNAYKLTTHFILAMITIGFMVKIIADVYNFQNTKTGQNLSFPKILIALTFLQLIIAGLMSGMKAALFFPTWPDMNGSFIPNVLLNGQNYTWENMTNYDTYQFAPALIQFIHRSLAYIIFILIYYYFIKYKSILDYRSKNWLTTSFVLIHLQLFLGIMTLLKVQTGIPLFYGISHQLVGLLFFISLLFLAFALRDTSKISQ